MAFACCLSLRRSQTLQLQLKLRSPCCWPTFIQRSESLISLLMFHVIGLNLACDTKVLCVCRLKPLVVLTDLKEDYRFYWLDGRTIRVYPAPSSSAAWGLIDLLFESEEVTEGGVVPKTLDADVMPVAKRQRLVLEGAAAGEGVANLSELEGFLDPQELQTSYVSQLLQQLHRSPAFQTATSDFNPMYV